MMGIKDTSDHLARASGGESGGRETATDKETRARMQEYNATRGPSLYNAHQARAKSGKGEGEGGKDDDPSARAFDREKDIAGGLQINATKRMEMMKKAGDFSSRFSEARYL